MRRILAAGMLAATLGACSLATPAYQSIETIVAHPQNYDGCEITVRGTPRITGANLLGKGKMRVEFIVISGDRGLASHGTIDSKRYLELLGEFNGMHPYKVTGTFMHGGLEAKRAENSQRNYLFGTESL